MKQEEYTDTLKKLYIELKKTQEKLHHLEALPDHGFIVVCFPVKIRAGSAGWTRAVAIIDDGLTEAAVAPIKP